LSFPYLVQGKREVLQQTRQFTILKSNRFLTLFFYLEIRNRKIYIKKKARSEKKRTLFYILNLSIRGDPMKNVTDSFISLDYWPSAGSFGFNTDILATNPINLSVVLGGLIFFGKGVCASCLFQE